MQTTIVDMRVSLFRFVISSIGIYPLVFAGGCSNPATENEVVHAQEATTGGENNSASVTTRNRDGKDTAAMEEKLMDQLGLKGLAVEPKSVVQKPTETSEKSKVSETRESVEWRRRWIQTHELPLETWEIQFLGNRPVGYNYELIKGSAIGIEGILRIDAKSFARISKGNEKLNQKLEIASVEQIDGKLRSVEIEFSQGDATEKTTGTVVLGNLRLRTESKDGIKSREIKWRPEVGGPFAIMQTLRRKPMKPGEVRELEMLDPLLGEVVSVELAAGDYINTPRLDGEQISMLEIRSTATYDRRKQQNILWTDENGLLQKSFSSRYDIRSFKCDESMVARVRDALVVESKEVKTIPILGETEGIESAPNVMMKITHSDGDAFRLIPQDEFQVLQNVAPFDITFRLTRPPVLNNEFELDAERKFISDLSYRQASPILQANDSIIKRIAAEFLADESLGQQPLQRLVIGVGKWITDKTPYSPAMETASETVRIRRGSGNEHAILLAAVIRSQGIPSRMITGLRVKPGSNPAVLEYHAWTEVEVNERWVAVDAMQPTGETNSTYIRLNESSLSNYNPYEAMIPTLDVMNKLNFEVIQPK